MTFKLAIAAMSGFTFANATEVGLVSVKTRYEVADCPVWFPQLGVSFPGQGVETPVGYDTGQAVAVLDVQWYYLIAPQGMGYKQALQETCLDAFEEMLDEVADNPDLGGYLSQYVQILYAEMPVVEYNNQRYIGFKAVARMVRYLVNV